MIELPRKTGCEAPNHNKDCPCINCTNRDCLKCPLLTKDHFTPKCIAIKALGWKYKQVNHPRNIQWLSKPCHEDKDRSTPLRYEQLLAQSTGAKIEFGGHIT